MIPVESSSIAAIDYKMAKKILTIKFNTGRVYEYTRVPEVVFDGLIAAESIGHYFWGNVRGLYDYREIHEKERQIC